jgi:hypothetical protein
MEHSSKKICSGSVPSVPFKPSAGEKVFRWNRSGTHFFARVFCAFPASGAAFEDFEQMEHFL